MTSSGLRMALELVELGVQLRAQRHRRQYPGAPEAEIRQVVADWYSERPMAPNGDSSGRVVAWPRRP